MLVTPWRTFRHIFKALVLASCFFSSLAMAATEAPEAKFRTIEWPDLIPPEVLEILLNPPEYVSQIADGSAEDQIGSQMKSDPTDTTDDPYQQALISTDVNSEMDGELVKVPGFIVPLEFDDAQTVTQFFLVPYFGACLHMPPPPPNQIILVESPQGVVLPDLFSPFWISGELKTTLSENDMATSAYSMTMMNYELYTD